MANSPAHILYGENSEVIAKSIAESYCTLSHEGRQGLTPKEVLADFEVQRFSDGEFKPIIHDSVRGSYCFVVQSTNPPSDNLMEMLMMIDACRRASAQYITAVIPYYGFARQDRKDRPRVSIGAKLVANLLTAAGADRVMTLDLHAGQIQGFFDIPVDHLEGAPIFIPHIKSLGLENLMFASPDVGSTKRTRMYSQVFNTDFVICDKHRSEANQIGEMRLIGNVEDKNVILVDDMIDTAGTMCRAADLLMESGARSVRAICTHPVLSGPAYDRISSTDSLTEMIVTDSIPLKQESSKIRVLSTAELFATAIRNAHEHRSINSLFINQYNKEE